MHARLTKVGAQGTNDKGNKAETYKKRVQLCSHDAAATPNGRKCFIAVAIIQPAQQNNIKSTLNLYLTTNTNYILVLADGASHTFV